MSSEDHNPIKLVSNYSGGCEHSAFTNEDIFKITSQMGDTIYGPTLFALKYRVVPCTLRRNTQHGGNENDPFTVSLTGQFHRSGRFRSPHLSKNQAGIYHATRCVFHFFSNQSEFYFFS